MVERGRPAWVPRIRRLGLLLVLALLCGAAYLAGIWTGMSTHVTCTTSAPGRIVCGDDVGPGTPAAPVTPGRSGPSV